MMRACAIFRCRTADRAPRAAPARRHYRVVDAFTPYPVEELAEVLDHRPGRIRVAMFIGGMAMAALAYGLEYYSAVINYPYNSGGRPLDAWPAFMLVPFATGILVASVCRPHCISVRDRPAAAAPSAICGRRLRAGKPGPVLARLERRRTTRTQSARWSIGCAKRAPWRFARCDA